MVQVYASRPGSSVQRPVRWLAGYAAATAGPGEEVTVTVPVGTRAFAHWDVQQRAWAVEPGAFTLHVGRSAGDVTPVGSVVPGRG